MTWVEAKTFFRRLEINIKTINHPPRKIQNSVEQQSKDPKLHYCTFTKCCKLIKLFSQA